MAIICVFCEFPAEDFFPPVASFPIMIAKDGKEKEQIYPGRTRNLD